VELALSLITPPNGIGGGGSCLPLRVTVALGEPARPVICWARTALPVINQATIKAAPSDRLHGILFLIFMLPRLLVLMVGHVLRLV
jgi:hypothetical protein